MLFRSDTAELVLENTVPTFNWNTGSHYTQQIETITINRTKVKTVKFRKVL